MKRPGAEPVGAVLAGGLGRRIGGSKALVQLCGRPLIDYPVQAMRAALEEVMVIAKPDTVLPSLPGVTVWIESEPEHHPLAGLREALGLAAGRAVLVCAADLPFVTAGLITALAQADPRGAPAIVAGCDGTVQPLLGVYQPAAGTMLAGARLADNPPLRDVVGALWPRMFDVGDPDLLFNVNAPEDILRAGAMLDARRSTRR